MLLVDDSWRDDGGFFRFVVVEESLIGVVRFNGRGSMGGTRAFLGMLETAAARLEPGQQTRSVVDMTRLTGTPLSAQLVLGKWLLKNRGTVKQLAVFGARPWERRIAKGICKLGRLKAVGFFKYEDEATDFLGLPRGAVETLAYYEHSGA